MCENGNLSIQSTENLGALIDNVELLEWVQQNGLGGLSDSERTRAQELMSNTIPVDEVIDVPSVLEVSQRLI
jgi:hypothetical protein